MKEKVRYCKRCDRDTKHDLWTETLGFEGGLARGLSFVWSLGMSEMHTYKYAECQRCGRVKEIR
jgi:hypothetical protein